MPCLNESESLEICVKKALAFINSNSIKGEVLVADNGSTDGSPEIAERCGARVIKVPVKGYGAALRAGTRAASGKFVIMGDADDSYNFLELYPFICELRKGADLVIGNRFRGGIAKGAMPPLHRYFGNPILSFLGRLFFFSKIGDFHCGLRGYKRDSILSLELHTTGMEYASEMIVRATIENLKIVEVPTTLDKDKRSRPPHLRSWQDGWRHLKFMLMYSPGWIFLYPGAVLFFAGISGIIILSLGEVQIRSTILSFNTMLYMAVAAIIGYNLVLFSVLTRVYGIENGFLSARKIKTFRKITTEKCVVCGLVSALTGFVLALFEFIHWNKIGFGMLDITLIMRITIPALVLMVIGIYTFCAGFIIGFLRIKKHEEYNNAA
jgi:glycosyltransferase involved in cell wall biosynthesis